jgi:methenyltetrahydrofolate cyclohydrolase
VVEPSASSSWLDEPLARFVEQIADKTPAPGGGSTAAVVAAMGAALVEMAARFSNGWDLAEDAVSRARQLRELALPLARRDAQAYEAVLRARTEEERHAALHAASAVPLELAELAAHVARLGAETAEHGKVALRGDAAAGAILAAAAARVAANLVSVNLAASPGDERVQRGEELAGTAAISADRALSAP